MIDCEDIIKKALGRDLKDDEADEFLKQAEWLVQKIRARAKANGTLPDILDAAKQWGKSEELAALAKKRNTYMQIRARAGVLDFCLNNFKGMEAEGINALLAGSKYARFGARMSVSELGDGLKNSYLGQLTTGLEALGPAHVKLFNNRALGRDIAEAMFLFTSGRESEFKGPKEALDIARVINEVQERARMDANKAGAWIGKLEGYIVRQSHDQAKIRKAGFEAWRQEIEPRLDWSKIFGGALDPVNDPDAVTKFLQATWSNLATGNHLKYVRGGDALATNSNIGSQAARMSHERVLHFKSGGDWYDYNAKFGTGSLHEAIGRGLEHSAKGTALMKQFGPAPGATIDWVIDRLKKILRDRDGTDAEMKVNQMEKTLRGEMELADGSSNIDGNLTFAAVGRNLRAVESMAKLGGAIVSSISDVPNIGYELAYQGMGFFRGLGESLRHFVGGRPSLEQQQVCSSLGVFFDSLTGGISARFFDDSLSGKMAAAQNMFFKLNLLTYWTDNWKKSVALTMSHYLATMKDNAWGQLSKAMRRSLELYGIDEGRWDLLRKASTVLADGRDYFSPDGIAALPDDHFVKFLEARGRKATQGAIIHLKDELQDQLRTFFRDRVQYAVLEPDLKNRYWMGRGYASGTAGGEILRYATQFKSFPTLFMQRTMSRELYGRGAETRGQAWKSAAKSAFNLFRGDTANQSNFISMFLAMSAFGYLAMQSKALLAGKTPREMNSENWYKVWMAAMAQGGGLGIFGDFLFGDFSRMGHGLTATLAGPTFGTLESLAQITSKLKNGEDLKASVAQFIATHIPGNNLFYLNLALQRLFWDRVYEKLNPGYLRRMEQRIWRDNRQTFWLPPTQ